MRALARRPNRKLVGKYVHDSLAIRAHRATRTAKALPPVERRIGGAGDLLL